MGNGKDRGCGGSQAFAILHFHFNALRQTHATEKMDTTDAPQVIEHVNKSLSFTPNDTKWIPCSARFVAMGIYPKATGAITVYGLNQGELKTHMEIEKKDGIKCGTFGASALEDRHLATGDYGGVMSIWYICALQYGWKESAIAKRYACMCGV